MRSCGKVFVGALTALLVGAQNSSAADQWADTPLVVKDQYLIELSTLGANASTYSSAAIVAEGLRISQRFAGDRAVLLSPLFLPMNGSTEPEYVPLDREQRVCKRLLKSGVARRCEPNFKVSASAIPNDPQYGSLWGMAGGNGVDAARAWDVTTDSQSVVVAVIDTGIDYQHPDLAENMWVNPGEIPGNGIDDDGNGYVDDVHGINALANSGNPMDDNSHGTHVAGTIGARGGNGRGVTGVNWRVQLMGLKFLAANGSGSIAGAIKAIDYMVLMKQRGVNIRISNNSWGGPGYSQALADAIERASAAGIIFVAAAGNEANDNDMKPSYPAGYDSSNIVSVAAIDAHGNLANFSNYGAQTVDIAAPGVGILSTTPRDSYGTFSGTSMAAPHVSGVLALLLGVAPSLTPSEAIQRLYDTALPLDTLRGVTRTARTVNAGRLILNESDPLPPPPPDPARCALQPVTGAGEVDTRADQAGVLVESTDELGFVSVTLPFYFPFDGQNVSRVVLSPNGVMYFRQHNLMDWQVGPKAPLNSFAPLHADLTSTIRVSLSQDSATFLWQSTLYGNPAAGRAFIRVTLYKDGSIKQWLNFSNPAFIKALRNEALIGMSGRAGGATSTYSYRDGKLGNDLSLTWVPLCAGDQRPLISGLQLFGIDRDGQRLRNLKAGQRFRLKVRGAGSAGETTASVEVDGVACNEPVTLSVNPGGHTQYLGRLSKRAGYFRHLTIRSQAASSTRRIVGKRALRRRAPARAVSTVCSEIARSLRRRR